jgi:H+/gluconate symporter-like permease
MMIDAMMTDANMIIVVIGTMIGMIISDTGMKHDRSF